MSSILSRTFKRRRFSSARRTRRMLKIGKNKAATKEVKEFMKWCHRAAIELHPNVSIQKDGCCDGIGVVAREAIRKGECVALIPRAALLSCANSNIKDHVKADKKLQQASSWIPLLLALATEYSYKEDSMWYPYLSIVPSTTSSLPMFWAESMREPLLEGTGVSDWVTTDLQRIEEDYKSLVKPFVERHPQVAIQNCDEYKKLVAYVMSYSFTDQEAGLLGTTVMVPFVDILNHSSTHHVELTFHTKCLRLIAVRNISKGEEIMNTYGQLSNAALLHKYGFTERNNPHEEVMISSRLVREVFLRGCCDVKYWDVVVKLGAVEEEYYVGGYVDAALLMLVRLLCTDSCKKKTLQKCPQPLSLQDCSAKELLFLRRLVEQRLQAFPEQVISPEPLLSSYSVSSIENHSWRVVFGQQNLLRKFLADLARLAS